MSSSYCIAESSRGHLRADAVRCFAMVMRLAELQRLIALIETRERALCGLANAPGNLGNEAVVSRLGEPASQEAIARLESLHGALPAAYKAFLTLHDGWQGFPAHRGRARLFSCSELASDEAE